MKWSGQNMWFLDTVHIKLALYTVFAMDRFVIHEQFFEQHLWSREFSDMYLAELCKLVVLFGSISDCRLTCTFVKELPNHVKQLFCTSSWMELLTIEQLLNHTWGIMKDKNPDKNLPITTVEEIHQITMQPPPRVSNDMICDQCNGLNNFAKDCKGLLSEGGKPCIQ